MTADRLGSLKGKVVGRLGSSKIRQMTGWATGRYGIWEARHFLDKTADRLCSWKVRQLEG